MSLLRLVLAGLLLLLLLPPAARAADAPGADTSGAGPLAATSEVPWTPPAPVPAAHPWETALRVPGFLLSLPLQALGRTTESGLVYVEDSNLIPRALALLAFQRHLGLAVTPASLGDGTGWGGAVSWSPPVIGRHVTGEVSGSTAGYNRERAALFVGPVRAVYTSEWRPEDPFFGIGMDTRHGDETGYAVRSQSARLTMVWPHVERSRVAMQMVDGVLVHPAMPADAPARTQLALWGGPDQRFVTHGRGEDPSFETSFPGIAAVSLDRRVERLIYGARLTRDQRFGLPRWNRGWRASVEAERHDRSIEALALKDAHSDARTFTRFTYAAEAGVSAGTDPRTVRLAVRVVDQVLDRGGGAFLIPDFVSLGGAEGLSGFEAGRFRDVDLVLGRLSYIFPLGKNLEFDWHVEAGGAFPHLSTVRPDRLETSYGGLLRVRADHAMLGAVGVEWSRESVRLRFSIGGVE